LRRSLVCFRPSSQPRNSESLVGSAHVRTRATRATAFGAARRARAIEVTARAASITAAFGAALHLARSGSASVAAHVIAHVVARPCVRSAAAFGTAAHLAAFASVARATWSARAVRSAWWAGSVEAFAAWAAAHVAFVASRARASHLATRAAAHLVVVAAIRSAASFVARHGPASFARAFEVLALPASVASHARAAGTLIHLAPVHLAPIRSFASLTRCAIGAAAAFFSSTLSAAILTRATRASELRPTAIITPHLALALAALIAAITATLTFALTFAAPIAHLARRRRHPRPAHLIRSFGLRHRDAREGHATHAAGEDHHRACRAKNA